MAPYYLGSYILFLFVILLLITYNFYYLILEITILKKKEITKANFNYQLTSKIKNKEVHLPKGHELLFLFKAPTLFKEQQARAYNGMSFSGIRIWFINLNFQKKYFMKQSGWRKLRNINLVLTNKRLFISNEIRAYNQSIKFDYNLNDIIRTSFAAHNSIALQINKKAYPLIIHFNTKSKCLEFTNAIWSIKAFIKASKKDLILEKTGEYFSDRDDYLIYILVQKINNLDINDLNYQKYYDQLLNHLSKED